MGGFKIAGVAEFRKSGQKAPDCESSGFYYAVRCVFIVRLFSIRIIFGGSFSGNIGSIYSLNFLIINARIVSLLAGKIFI